MMFKLAFRNIFRQHVRTAITLAAIVFGVVGLILGGGFVRDIFFQLGEALIHSQSGHLQVVKTGYFTYGSRSPEKFLITDAQPLKRELAKIPEIQEVLERVSFTGLLNNGKTDWPIVADGVEPDSEARLGSFMQIVEGRQLSQKDNFGVTVGQGVAKALNLKPGDRVSLLVNTPEGALNTMELDIVGIFQSFSKDYDARFIRLPLPAAHELLGSQGINSLVISLKQTSDTEVVSAKLKATLNQEQYESRTWVQLNDFYEKTVALYKQQFGFLQLIILIMVLLSVANSVSMSIFERTGEFGTIMATGSRPLDVIKMLATESAMLGLIGSVLGVVFGIAAALLISKIGIPMPPPPNANLGYMATIQLSAIDIFISFMIGFVATTVACIWPGMRVTKLPVIDALRQNQI
ncbi:ABC transporter permease [Ferribacterium limneticum]|uniref:ABC transporter permease n=1 Tax=Ferribacterium limneticum TaxID=76259 RepID=UPI001CFB5278|nr:ABC transporter permease [Ferribacterium limneticum]UCV17340.1 ABC transporter permease [Ferribacterium limneticum]